MEFEKARGLLEQLGLKYHQEKDYRGPPPRDPQPQPLFSWVTAGFSPGDWRRIASRDGSEYIGGCCGQASAMQDIVCGWSRDGDMKLEDLEELAQMAIIHDGKGSIFDVLPTDWVQKLEAGEINAASWKKIRCWDRLAIVWYIVKDCHSKGDFPLATRRDHSEVERATFTVANVARGLNIHRMFSREEADLNPQDKALMALVYAKFIPALKVLYERVRDVAPQPFEGYALIDRERDAVAENGFGLCLFETREQAEAMFREWEQQAESRTDHRSVMDWYKKVALRPVRVSVDLPEGFEYTGPVEEFAKKVEELKRLQREGK